MKEPKAQLNVTLNQDEMLQLLFKSRDEAFRKLLEARINSIIKAESQEQLKAQPYERTEERTDSKGLDSAITKQRTLLDCLRSNCRFHFEPGIHISKRRIF